MKTPLPKGEGLGVGAVRLREGGTPIPTLPHGEGFQTGSSIKHEVLSCAVLHASARQFTIEKRCHIGQSHVFGQIGLANAFQQHERQNACIHLLVVEHVLD